MERVAPGEATTPSEAKTPPQLPERSPLGTYEANGDLYVPPAADRDKIAAYLDTVSDEDEENLWSDGENLWSDEENL